MKKILFILLLIVAKVVTGQITSFSPSMINTTGGSGIVAGTYYDYTVGEPITLFGGSSCDSLFSGFQYCAIDTHVVKKTNITVGGPLTFCINSSVTLTAPAGVSYLWNNGATTQSISAMVAGTYYVRVTNTCGDTILSNPILATTINPPVPTICLVTVDSVTSAKNMIVWEKPVATTAIDSFVIYRNISAVMTRIAAQPYSALTIYVDTTNGVNPKQQAYEYALSIIDTCGNESALSTHHITINQIPPVFAPPSTFTLQWSDYQGFTFADYEIWRDGNNNGNWVKIGNVQYTLANQYIDLTAPSDSASYRIDAVPAMPCNATIKNPDPLATVKSSKSNSSDKTIAGSVGQELEDATWISVYPNPSNGFFSITSNKHSFTNIRLFNIIGETVFSNNVTAKKTDIAADLPNGVYQLQITTNSGTVNRKIVISR